MPDELEIVSLNCWGLKYISELTDERIAHIADELANGTSDIVCLQEIWQRRHWRLLRDRVKDRLPHSKYFYSGMMGSGLAILSRHPIIGTDMRPYTLNGRPQAFYRGDWFVGKGVASVVILLPSKRKCQIFNTHMHAPYNERVDTYLCHRTAQGWDLRKMLKASVEAGYLTFATGDFNSVPGSLVHRFLTTYLSDSFITLNPELPLFPDSETQQSAQELVDVYGATCDVSPLNSWRQTQAPDMEAKRLDYVFHDDKVVPKSVQVIFTERVPLVNCSPSDHFGLSCRYIIKESGWHTYRPLDRSDYDEMLSLVNQYMKRERLHSELRIGHFWVSVVALFYIHYRMFLASPIVAGCLGLLSLVVAVTGLMSGLVGAIFGWWELRSLYEFRDEVYRSRRMYALTIEAEE
ncbi:Endonuclease/exonuclease/phosphatase [Protomyces lactucae-debilis]|uniref:Endonuclease/exonuclease/phosphatase n=1 Tax=Protomyces lactucae-debilis TaxID=2754530 RepID=A0A1Y2FU56_PROLT|nr:Endonuclease/exonuclease/phosphatase [Protomyces lactucae-debilis]ORY87097.1 Endonuclease/exonuclease/phosphatase [Protomyces lactucae-debilis]